MRALAALLCLAATSAAAAPITALTREARFPERCAVVVEFVSVCCGPDRVLAERIERAVVADRRIRRAYSRPWGREGEATLCLVTGRRADARAVARRFAAWARAADNPTLTTVKLGDNGRPNEP